MSTTISGQQSTDSLNGKLTFEQDKNRIVGRDEDNKIGLLIGTDPFVVKIAKDGFDVLTAGDDDLIFNSSQNVFKIVYIGTGTTPIASVSGSGYNSNGQQNIYPHGLGYRPVVMAFLDDGTLSTPTPWSYNVGPSGGGIATISHYAATDETNVYIVSGVSMYAVSSSTVSTPSWPVKYYLLQESAN